ncbi:MFS transporter fmqE [Fusarium oxysporum f. sp. cubense]|uniref:MFS transporter fmqE n=1 Tax=Fusarium oxysporum f. sp. cubense TaxID=61366 RepID=A0A559KW83_FUSOC|nr:MFS transporter fmqE [Fusarium oxysporum f. sp. cubense]
MATGPERKSSVEQAETIEEVQQNAYPTEHPLATLRSHPKLVLYALIANIGPLMFGYDLIIVGAISALPKFRIDFGDHAGPTGAILPAIWLGLWNGLVQAGTAAGALFAGWFQDRFGRRASFALGGLLGMIGTAFSYTCGMPDDMEARRGLFLFAKIVIGMGCGMLMSSCQTYISEIAPKNVRGVLLGFYAFNVSLGHLIAVAIVFPNTSEMSSKAYRIPFATQWVFGGLSVIVALLLPESPVWLIYKRKMDKATRSLNKLGTGNDESMLERIQTTLATEAVTEDAGEGSGYSDCFKGTNLRRTAIIIWLNLIQQFVGMALLTNGAYFLIMAGMSPQYSLMVNLIGVASNMVANAISWYTVPRFGRRTMILFSISLDILAWASMGIAACFSTQTAQWYVGVALLLFGFFNSLGVASAVPVIASEISTVRLRAKTGGIGFGAQCIAAWAFSFYTPYLYNTDQANWKGKIGFFFAGLSAVGYVISWLTVPETKGRSFLDLDFLFGEKVKARAFRKTAVPSIDDDVDNQKEDGKESF